MRQPLSYTTRLSFAIAAAAAPCFLALCVLAFAAPLAAGDIALIAAVAAITTFAIVWHVRGLIVYRLYTLSNLLAALREGDTSLRGKGARRDDAYGDVVWEINALAQTLRAQRQQVEESDALLAKVVAATDIALFAFDAESKLKLVNPAGAQLLGRSASAILGRSVAELRLDLPAPGDGTQIVLRDYPGGSGRYEFRRAVFRDGGLAHELVSVSDLSRALRDEERAAWQRLIRVFGHEINNSLAPIQSMAATLADLNARAQPPADWREDLAGGLALIGHRAQALTRFLNGYAALARLPSPRRRETDLAALLARAAKLEQRLAVDVAPLPALRVAVDADQIEQATINLLRNAVDATLATGGAVTLRLLTDHDHASIVIEDEGSGLAATENLFVPFFTTKPEGSGIGLALARQIAEAHGGTLSLRNRDGARGCAAQLVLPLRGSAM